MTIRLQIDNLDALPDGGPLFYEAHERGFEIGREHRDWTLPDPNMFISGRHCEIRFEKGGYWLYDFSRNGTFVNGSRQRVSSPYRLNSGDRLTIGHYTVSVTIDAGAPVAQDDAGAAPFASPVSDDIWETGAPSPPPISRRDLMAPQARGRRSADFSEQYLELPPIRQDDGFADRQRAAHSRAGRRPVRESGARLAFRRADAAARSAGSGTGARRVARQFSLPFRG
jgi:type VI secretion system protein ImpI